MTVRVSGDAVKSAPVTQLDRDAARSLIVRMDLDAFGDAVFAWRDSRGWTQPHAASVVDVHPNTIMRWERGKATPKIGTLIRLVAAGCVVPGLETP